MSGGGKMSRRQDHRKVSTTTETACGPPRSRRDRARSCSCQLRSPAAIFFSVSSFMSRNHDGTNFTTRNTKRDTYAFQVPGSQARRMCPSNTPAMKSMWVPTTRGLLDRKDNFMTGEVLSAPQSRLPQKKSMLAMA
uniref:Uncharacterized protein n=1 Tax=Arundo donax TaxID=35708 RepID=A0A0A9FBM0_ARUDO